MTSLELLKKGAELAYGELWTSLSEVTEEQAWAVLPNQGADYLHSGGSIYSVAMHVASLKWMKGSVSFRNGEIRWRDAAAEIEAFEPSWTATLDYLERGHRYWMESWADLEDLEAMRPSEWKEGDYPAWKIIQIVTQHDAYHAGQIGVLRYGCPPSDVRPASEAEEIRTYCRDLPGW